MSEISLSRKKFEADISYRLITSPEKAVWTWLIEEEIYVKPICESEVETFWLDTYCNRIIVTIEIETGVSLVFGY